MLISLQSLAEELGLFFACGPADFISTPSSGKTVPLIQHLSLPILASLKRRKPRVTCEAVGL